jgi:hypothetical protein
MKQRTTSMKHNPQLIISQQIKKFVAILQQTPADRCVRKAFHWSLFLSKMNPQHNLPPDFCKFHCSVIIQLRLSRHNDLFPSVFNQNPSDN